MTITLSASRVGKDAYKVSKTWRLGFHVFSTDHFHTIRLCYLQNESGTHYIELTKDRKVYDASA